MRGGARAGKPRCLTTCTSVHDRLAHGGPLFLYSVPPSHRLSYPCCLTVSASRNSSSAGAWHCRLEVQRKGIFLVGSRYDICLFIAARNEIVPAP